MRTTRRLAVAGTAAVGLALLASPAFAGNGPGDGSGCTGEAVGSWNGRSVEELGAGDGNRYGSRSATQTQGTHAAARQGGTGLAGLATGELTVEQEEALAFWLEEEKVARDLYTAFAEQYDAPVFERIARSEAQHMTAVQTLLERYGIADPTEGTAPGEFVNEELAALYASLYELGSQSYADALQVGQTVEKDDLEVLAELAEDVDAPDVDAVVARQIDASQRHLEAFGG